MALILCRRWREAREKASLIHRLLDEGKFTPANEANMLVYLSILYIHNESLDTADALLLRFWSKFGEVEGPTMRKKQLLALACKAGRQAVSGKIDDAINTDAMCK